MCPNFIVFLKYFLVHIKLFIYIFLIKKNEYKKVWYNTEVSFCEDFALRDCILIL